MCAARGRPISFCPMVRLWFGLDFCYDGFPACHSLLSFPPIHWACNMSDMLVALFKKMADCHSCPQIIVYGNDQDVIARFHGKIHHWNAGFKRAVIDPVAVMTYLWDSPDNSVYMAVMECLEDRSNICGIKFGQLFEK